MHRIIRKSIITSIPYLQTKYHNLHTEIQFQFSNKTPFNQEHNSSPFITPQTNNAWHNPKPTITPTPSPATIDNTKKA